MLAIRKLSARAVIEPAANFLGLCNSNRPSIARRHSDRSFPAGRPVFTSYSRPCAVARHSESRQSQSSSQQLGGPGDPVAIHSRPPTDGIGPKLRALIRDIASTHFGRGNSLFLLRIRAEHLFKK